MEDVVIRCMRFITGLFSSWAFSNKNNVNLKIFTLFSGLSQRKEKKEGMKETATTSGYRDRTFIQLISDWFRPKVNSTRHRSFYTSSPHSLYSLFLFLLRFYFWECRNYKTRIWAFSRAMVAIFGSYILDLICTRCIFFSPVTFKSASHIRHFARPNYSGTCQGTGEIYRRFVISNTSIQRIFAKTS